LPTPFLSTPVFFLSTLPAATVIYPLSLHDALPICAVLQWRSRIGHRHHILSLTGGDGGGKGHVGLLRNRPAGSGRHGSAGTHLRSEEHTSELQSRFDLVCRLLLDTKNKNKNDKKKK